MSKAIKLLVTGHESSGKSTLTSKIENALVVNFDRKSYNFPVPHINIPVFTGTDNLIDVTNEKLGVYQEKYGKLPATVVFDTVTQLYTAIQSHNEANYKGFTVHSNNNRDTLQFNAYVEDVLIANGVNVVITAHVVYDADTSRYVVPATGTFKSSGSWISVVNNSIFIEKKSGKLVVHQNSLKLPARTTIEGIEASVPVDSYDINKHIKTLVEANSAADDFCL